MSIRYLSGINVDNNVLFVDDVNNRVGIGTGSPVSSLNINNGDAFINVTDTLRGLQFGFAGPSHGSYRAAVMGGAEAYGGTDSGMLTFHTQNGYVVSAIPPERMRITSAGNVGIGTTAPITKLSIGAYSGSRLPYINATANTFDANGITVTSSNTANATIGGGIDLTNNVHSVGSFSPLISFSALSQSGTYNNNYAAIYGILAGAGGDANWNTGHIVFATAESYGASEKMRITSAGLVAIGNTNPQANSTSAVIDIGNTTGGTVNLRDTDAGASGLNQIFGGNNQMYFYAGSSGASSVMQFYTNDVERMRLTSDGHLIVKSTTSGGGTQGDFYVIENGGLVIDASEGATQRYIEFTTGGTTKMLIAAAGNVGIGTTNPLGITNNSGLQINRGGHTTIMLGNGTTTGGVVQSSDDTRRVFIGANVYDDVSGSWSQFDGNAGYAAFDVIGDASYGLSRILVGSPGDSGYASSNIFFEAYKSDATSYVKMRTATDNVLYLTNGGNVGIGTTNPLARLNVWTPSSTGQQVGLRLNNPFGFDNLNTGAKIVFSQDRSTSEDIPMGELGVGQGDAATSVNGYMYFSTKGSNTMGERMRITSAGNVLINTTTDAGYKLDVSGTARTLDFSIKNSANAETLDLFLSPSVFNAFIDYPTSRDLIFRNKTTGTALTLASTGAATFSSSVTASSLIKSGGTSAQYLMADGSVSTLTNPVTGTGTTNYIPKFTGASAIGDSIIYETSNLIGIGTTSPTQGGGNAKWVTIDGTSYSGGIVYSINSVAKGYTYVESDLLKVQAQAGVGISFITNGNESARITSAGNVGIGTTTPGALLQVGQGSTDTNALIRLSVSYTGTTPRGGIVWHDTANVTGKIHTDYNGSTMTSMVFGSLYNSGYNSNPLMVIRGDGNVGIGTTSPAAKLSLGANDFMMVSVGSGGKAGILFHETGTATATDVQYGAKIFYDETLDVLQLSTRENNVDKLGIAIDRATGNVGIGTTAPSYKLDVNGGSDTTVARFYNSSNIATVVYIGDSGNTDYSDLVLQTNSGTGEIFKAGTGYTSYGGALALNIYNSNGAIAFHPNNTVNAMFIATNSNVGIGTTAPATKLHIHGYTTIDSVDVVAAFSSDNTAKRVNIGYSTSGDYGFINAVHTGVAWKNLIFGVNGGNVGIGTTSPSNKLHIRQTGIVDNTATTLLLLDGQFQDSSIEEADMVSIGFRVENSSGGSQTSQAISFAYNNILSLMKDGGNVLIGTTTDSGYKLAVNGTITSANYSYLSTYGYGATQLRTYEISTGTSVSDNQVFNLYLGRFGNGYHRITLWSTGYGTDSGNYFDITRTWNGTPYIITNGGLIVSAAQYTIHWAAVGSGQYDLFIKWYAGMPTGYSNLINYAIQSNTGYQYVQFDYPGGVTVPTLDGSNLVASRMTIQYTTGNVGIGTTSPAAKLDVNGSIQAGSGSTFGTGSNGASIYMSSASSLGLSGNLGGYSRNLIKTDGTSVIEIGDTGTSIITAINISAGDATGVIALKTGGNNTRLYVNSSGNVGIGTTNPLNLLHVSQASANTIFRLGNNASYDQFIYFNGGNDWSLGMDYSNSNAFVLSNSSSIGTNDRVVVTTAGNVGIGTTAPSAYLDVKGLADTAGVISLQLRSGNTSANFNSNQITLGYANTADYRHAIKSRHNSGAGAGNAIDFYIWNNSLNASDIATNPIMSIDTTNVGIGTTVPTEKLHVDGSTLITYNNSFQSTNSVNNKAILARVSPTSGIVNYAEYATATNLNGFVIGSDDARVKGNIATDSLEFITNTSTRMTILSGGNVGINTTVPGSTLHVVGDVLIQTGALGVGVSPNATDGRIDASNDIVAFSTSDKRLKENITPIANALEKVRSLTGVEFDWKEETKSVHGYEGHDVGVIAQDVQAVLPEAVRTNDSGYLSVRYEKMIALLVEAMKEQQAQIEELKKLIK